VDALDKTANNAVMKTYFLRRSDAATITEVINNLYKQITSRGRGGGAQPGQPPPQPGQPQPSTGRPAVVAVADTRMNAVIVVASQDNHEQIAKNIINRLDDDEGILDTKTRKLKYADAADVANTVNTILSNMRPGGAGGGNPSFGGRAFGGFDPFGGGGGNQQTVNSTDPMGKVTADARTNTLFITASPDKMRKIEELIDKVDVEVPAETTTFIFPLKNAPAQDVAEALTQAFNTGRQNNGFGGFFFGGFGGGGSSRSTQRRQRINRRFGQDNNNNNPFGRSAPVPPPNAPDGNSRGDGGNNTQGGSAIPQGIQGVMTPNGFVPNYNANDPNADERTRQFYDYYGYGRQRGIGQNRGPQYGRGRSGGYSNLLQLQNNVFVTPSPGGDSLIVTTTPDNYNILKSLIEQLDQVQRQVVIECIIAEVTLESTEKLGMALGGTFSRIFKGTNEAKIRTNLPIDGASNAFDANGAGTQFSLKGVNYDALVQALTTDNKVKILSTPRIFTTNNQEAQIELVTQIPYITSQNQGLFGGGGVGQEVQFVEPGLFLNVIPSITRDGMVTIDVLQEASELLRFDNLGTGISTIRAPVTNLRSANTLVTVQDNETVAIGGLIRENYSTTINKVPILSELPLVGQLFRSRERQKSRVELVIFLTPRIVNTVQDARDMTLKNGASIIRDIPDIKKIQPALSPVDEKKPGEKRKEKKPVEKREEPPKREEETTEPPETP
jgi:general secretion pathway protein D